MERVTPDLSFRLHPRLFSPQHMFSGIHTDYAPTKPDAQNQRHLLKIQIAVAAGKRPWYLRNPGRTKVGRVNWPPCSVSIFFRFGPSGKSISLPEIVEADIHDKL